jgi:hypothetical protein
MEDQRRQWQAENAIRRRVLEQVRIGDPAIPSSETNGKTQMSLS